MVRVFKSTKREDIVARELQKQEIYTEKRTDNCDMLPSYRTMKFWGLFLESDLVSHYYLIFFSIFRRGKPALFLENTAKI